MMTHFDAAHINMPQSISLSLGGIVRNPDQWELIQIVSRQRLSGLSSAAVLQHLSLTPVEEQRNWYAWRAGMADWVCVFQLKEFSLHVNPPTLPEMTRVEPSAAVDRRKHPRHQVRTKIVILFNGQAFRSFSKDISMGGLLLLNHIPWKFDQKSCSVFVSNPTGGQALEFTGKVLSDPKDPLRVRFHDPSESFLLTLNEWIESAQLNLNKSAA